MKQILIVTDGACIGNPGPGGWACILRYKEHCRELSGNEPNTTNNRMELRAVIEGLRAVKEACHVVVKTDSQYLRDGITKWIHRWKQEGWQHKVKGSSRRQEIKNRDLWEQIDRLQALHDVRWEWTKGHSTDEDNNRCDVLANASARLLVDPARVPEISGR